jgi:hypothetical protein
MGNSKHRKIGIVILFMTIMLLSVVIISAADGVVPGSEQDPIVTQSYVEQKAEQITYYIDSLISVQNQEIEKLKAELELKNQEIANLKEEIRKAANVSTTFEVVEMQQNQILIAGEGAEIIPRSGKFSAIAGTNGNLSDISAARDLKAGEEAALNHMLIASRADGRGIKALANKSFLIIKGAYTIK